MKELSAGFLIESKYGYLALHPYGRRGDIFDYDFPKGHVENGETDLDGAIRELYEESGLILDEFDHSKIIDLGIFNYRDNKDLHLYYVYINDIPEKFNFYCSSYFDDKYKKRHPETIGYIWTKDTKKYYRSLQPLIEKIIKKNNMKFDFDNIENSIEGFKYVVEHCVNIDDPLDTSSASKLCICDTRDECIEFIREDIEKYINSNKGTCFEVIPDTYNITRLGTYIRWHKKDDEAKTLWWSYGIYPVKYITK